MRCSKNIYTIIIIVFAICLLLLVGCSTTSSNIKESEESGPSKEELDQLYTAAMDYYNNAQYKEAYNAFTELEKLNYTNWGDENFAPIGRCLAWTMRSDIICEYSISMANYIKLNLKDPNSFVLYSITVEKNEKENTKFDLTFDYGAKNGFGGMNRDSYTITFMLSSFDVERLRDAFIKDEWISENATDDEVRKKFISSSSDYHYPRMAEAITNDTATVINKKK